MSERDSGTPVPVAPWMRVLGWLLCLAALAIVAHRAWLHREDLAGHSFTAALTIAIAIGAVAYGLGAVLLTIAWRRLLSWESGRPLEFSPVHWSYARTYVAKYLPGNVMHLAGRHLFARRQGIPHAALFAAALDEMVSMLAAAGLLAAVGCVVARAVRPEFLAGVPLAVIAACALVGLALPAALHVFSRVRSRLPLLGRLGPPAHADGAGRVTLPVFALHVGFFSIAALAAIGLVVVELGWSASVALSPAVVVAYAASWAIGYVTPGAPAGIGVRELVLVGLLSQVMPETTSLLVAAAFRVVTFVGELVFFGTSFVVRGGGEQVRSSSSA